MVLYNDGIALYGYHACAQPILYNVANELPQIEATPQFDSIVVKHLVEDDEVDDGEHYKDVPPPQACCITEHQSSYDLQEVEVPNDLYASCDGKPTAKARNKSHLLKINNYYF